MGELIGMGRAAYKTTGALEHCTPSFGRLEVRTATVSQSVSWPTVSEMAAVFHERMLLQLTACAKC